MTEGGDARREVLSAVKTQTQLIPTSEKRVWTSEQWHAALQFLFFIDAQAGHDDLLFLIKDPEDRSDPYTVLRRAQELPAHLHISGASFCTVSWNKSLLLNLVLQGHYELTVTGCKQEHLTQVAEGLASGPGVTAITKQVFASPTRSQVNLHAEKVEEVPAPSYPSIFFSVENYDDVFNELVLNEDDECFCVVLKAVLAAAGTAAACHALLFSGYVTHAQIQVFLNNKDWGAALSIPALLGKLFNKHVASSNKPKPPSRCQVPLTGPGGIGRAMVAITQQPPSADSSAQAGTTTTPALSSAVSSSPSDLGASPSTAPTPLQCSLLSVCMPVDFLAQRILDGLT